MAAVAAMARRLGLPALLGPPCRSRDLVLGLIISRVIRPASKLSTLSRWADTTLGGDLGVAGASTDEVYAAMDWLADRQDAIEKKLAAKHLGLEANPSPDGVVRSDSSWVTGRCCELAALRLFPRRQERAAADRIRGAHRPGRASGGGAGIARQHRRPGRVHRHRRGGRATASGWTELVLVGIAA